MRCNVKAMAQKSSVQMPKWNTSIILGVNAAAAETSATRASVRRRHLPRKNTRCINEHRIVEYNFERF